MCSTLYNKHPGTKPAPLPMNTTKPKTPLPPQPPANTLAKQCSMWRIAARTLMDFPHETQKIRWAVFVITFVLCTGEWRSQ